MKEFLILTAIALCPLSTTHALVPDFEAQRPASYRCPKCGAEKYPYLGCPNRECPSNK